MKETEQTAALPVIPKSAEGRTPSRRAQSEGDQVIACVKKPEQAEALTSELLYIDSHTQSQFG